MRPAECLSLQDDGVFSDTSGCRVVYIGSGSTGSSLTNDDGYLPWTTSQVAQQAQVPDPDREMRAQVEAALASGLKITHFDLHMFAVANKPGLSAEYVKLSRSYGVPG